MSNQKVLPATITNIMAAKSINDTVVGELIALPIYGEKADIGVVVRHHESGEVFIAVLESGSAEYPPMHYLQLDEDTDCLSYGVDWAFEIVPMSNTTGFSADRDLSKPGTVMLRGGDLLLELGRNPFNIRSSGGTFDLARLTATSIRSYGEVIAVRAWRVWAHVDDMTNIRRQPLISKPNPDEIKT